MPVEEGVNKQVTEYMNEGLIEWLLIYQMVGSGEDIHILRNALLEDFSEIMVYHISPEAVPFLPIISPFQVLSQQHDIL